MPCGWSGCGQETREDVGKEVQLKECGHSLCSEACLSRYIASLCGGSLVCPVCGEGLTRAIIGSEASSASRFFLNFKKFSVELEDEESKSEDGMFARAANMFQIPREKLKLVVKGKVYTEKGGKVPGAVGTARDLAEYLESATARSIFVVGTPVLDQAQIKEQQEQLRLKREAFEKAKQEQKAAAKALLKAKADMERMEWEQNERKKLAEGKRLREQRKGKKSQCENILGSVSSAVAGVSRLGVLRTARTTVSIGWSFVSSLVQPEEDAETRQRRIDEQNRWNPQAQGIARVNNGDTLDATMPMGGG